jgi:predicted metalloprotease with PDZ domain
MMPSKLTTLLTVLVLSAATGGLRAQEETGFRYTVSMPEPGNHLFHIVVQAKGLKGPVQDFIMPAWMPGYYQILDYAKNLQDFRASNGQGQLLNWEKTAPNTWRVAHPLGALVRIEYDIKANTQFAAQSLLDSTHAYLAPTSLFLYPEGYLQHSVDLEIQRRPEWSTIATGLDTVAGKGAVYRAPDFDILYDCPILIGNLEALPSFTVRGIPHFFIGYHLGDFDREKFAGELKKVVEAGVNLMDDVPYRHYSFLAMGAGRGGVEHLNSTTVPFSGSGLNTPSGRHRMLTFLAHEYFHLYNVKRIRPIALGPFDYQRANLTNLLWVSEGLSVYYEYRLVRLAGLMTGEELLQDFQKNIASYENKPGHLYQSLAKSSYDTWKYGPLGGPADSTISYYDKGPAVGLLLDLAIRQATKNKKMLDDVMRTLYRVYYQGLKRGFTDEEFRGVCEKVAGIALPEIFDYVFTVKEPDYAKYLAYGGLGIDLEPHVLPDGKTERSCRIFPLPNPDAMQLAIRKSWLGE